MSKKITHEGIIDLNGFEIPCYVLEDGTRVLSGRGMQDALNMVDIVPEGKQNAGTRLTRYLDQKSLKPFIFKGKDVDHFKPIVCYKGDTKINGFEATILSDICDGFLEARKHIELSKRQQIIAEQAEILIRAFARVGIIALVDEATGYQEVREKDALKQFLQKFLLEERGKWVKTFPDEFFEMIFKMKGWTWSYASAKKPSVVGHYINDFVYSRIAPQILKELRERNPTHTGGRKAKHHQFLTPDYGHPKLKEHLSILIALGKAAGYNSRNFDRLINRALPKYGNTIEIPYFDEKENIT